MQSRDFCYWLQGFFELRQGSEPLDAAQVTLVKRHLDLVFQHAAGVSLREKPAELEPYPIAPPEPAPSPHPEPKEPPPPASSPPYPPPPAPMC
jgi:hypothetical protein